MLKSQQGRSEEHTSELQSPYVISYAVFCLKKTNIALRADSPISLSAPLPTARLHRQAYAPRMRVIGNNAKRTMVAMTYGLRPIFFSILRARPYSTIYLISRFST